MSLTNSLQVNDNTLAPMLGCEANELPADLRAVTRLAVCDMNGKFAEVYPIDEVLPGSMPTVVVNEPQVFDLVQNTAAFLNKEGHRERFLEALDAVGDKIRAEWNR